MKKSKKINELSELLKEESNINPQLVYQKVVDFLLDEGFTKKNLENRANIIYVLEDPDGESHIGKSYVFSTSQNIKDYIFTRKLGNGKEMFYRGVEAISALVKTTKIKNAINQAKSEGIYELLEHLSSSIDLDYSDD